MITDASELATIAVLDQAGKDGRRRVIAYESTKFNDAERRKTAYEKEMLAVLRALRVQLRCDNAAVTFIPSQPNLSPQQSRWVTFLSEYHYDVVHILGTENVVANALSRHADLSHQVTAITVSSTPIT